MLLHGSTAYVAAIDRLEIVNTGTGAVRRTFRPEHAPGLNPGIIARTPLHIAGPPVPAEVDGRQLVIAAFPVRVPRTGLLQRRFVELIALDAATGGTVWTHSIRTATWVNNQSHHPAPVIVGVHGHTLVLRVADTVWKQRHSSAYAIDLSSRELLWTRPIYPEVMAGDVLVGHGEERGVRAWSIDDGRQRWAVREDVPPSRLHVQPGGPDLVVVGDKTSVAAFDAADGTERLQADGPVGGAPLHCEYDGQSVTVCLRDVRGIPWIGAYDSVTAKPLWILPDQDSGAPDLVVTAAWHGVVYGVTGQGPVAFDARTGKELSPSPAVAPYLVSADVGLAVNDDEGGLSAYPVET